MGGHHAERAAQDASLTRAIAEHGYTVLRFWDNEVLKDIDGVLEAIAREVPSLPMRVRQSGSDSLLCRGWGGTDG